MRRTWLLLFLDVLFLFLFGLGVYRVVLKAGLPVALSEKDNALIISEIPKTSSLLSKGDTVSSLEGQPVYSNNEVEFFCNEHRIGDVVTVKVQRNGLPLTIPLRLIPYYSLRYEIVQIVVGALFYILGLFVLFRKPEDPIARLFHHLSLASAGLIFLTSGRYTAPWGYGLELLFHASYLLVPVLFIHFTLYFPRKQVQNSNRLLIPAYLLAAALTVWAGATFLRAALPSINLSLYSNYDIPLRAIRIFFIVSLGIGLYILLSSYRHAKEEQERNKLRWVLFGIAISALGFIGLWEIPQLMKGSGLVGEETILLLLVIAPVSFAIAIVRYRIFAIDLLIKRSTVYTLALGILLLIYVTVVWSIARLTHSYDIPYSIPDAISALCIALLFNPVRARVQRIVDKKFFRVAYDFREAQQNFFEQIKSAIVNKQLATLVVDCTEEILPVTRIGFFQLNGEGLRLQLLAHHNFKMLERRSVVLEIDDLKSELGRPLALMEKVEQGLQLEAGDSEMFNRWGIALVFPMLSGKGDILGFVVLGEKRSGERFTMEDISLLRAVTLQAGLTLERMDIERKLIIEQEESERLRELNELKSRFVAGVSHDLKTPLTSIRLLAEVIKVQEMLPREKAQEYLGIIEGEAERLSRRINNVLDFAQTEKGTKEYSFATRDLNTVVLKALHSLEYQIQSQGGSMVASFFPEPLLVAMDEDAILDAIINLISNAIKYSPPERRKITFNTGVTRPTKKDNGPIEIRSFLSVRDEGYGLAIEEIDHIFDPFYRDSDPVKHSVGGVGLGLSLVKHTMDAHRGSIEVKSVLGVGSEFSLHFPVLHR